VSELETIAQELQAMSAGIGQAQQAAAAADARAQEVTARAAISGFAGIVAGMARISAAIQEIRQRLTTIGHGLAEAGGPVSGAGARISPHETVTLLVQAGEQVTAARDGVSAAISQVMETQQLAGMVLHGGQPGPMIASLDTIRQALAETTQRAEAVQQRLSVAIVKARQLGGEVGE
jgi:hypothetical protein